MGTRALISAGFQLQSSLNASENETNLEKSEEQTYKTVRIKTFSLCNEGRHAVVANCHLRPETQGHLTPKPLSCLMSSLLQGNKRPVLYRSL